MKKKRLKQLNELDEIKIEQRQMKDEISEIKTMLLRLAAQPLTPQQQQQAQASVKGIEFDILGLASVPIFILGAVDAKDPLKVTGITTIRGAIPLDNFRQGLDLALKNQ